TGFTGNLVARLAVQRSLHPLLAGRNREKVEHQAGELGLDCRVFGVDDSGALKRALGEVGAVLNCAGPFAYTARPMMDGCLQAGTHYLDITGELPIYEAAAARDAEAQTRGVTLLPGVGVEIAPTDCLAVHLKRRLPAATHLTLAWGGKGKTGFSRGSTRTMMEYVDYGCRIRRNGSIEKVPLGLHSRVIDLGYGPTTTITFTWPDVFTAYYSTGIPNIEVLFPRTRFIARMVTMSRYLGPILSIPPIKKWMKRGALAIPPGPTDEERAASRGFIWGEVTDDGGGKAVSTLEGPNPGYTWTLITALDAVEKVVEGGAPAGFQTPGRAFGADFVLQCPDVVRRDVE
ncbi:MAG: saccharopine dehydrogenase family protein, partial [Rudaea sp.]